MQVSSAPSEHDCSFLADSAAYLIVNDGLTGLQQLWHHQNTALAAITGRQHNLQCMRAVPQDTEHNAPDQLQASCIKSSTRNW
jgi:hypothetical protein